jgi:beta-galactosidase
VTVPDADDLISYQVSGGRLVGLDNGREEDAEGYKGTSHTAFNGKAVAIVQSDPRPGPIRVTASAPGLRAGSTTVFARGGHTAGSASTEAPTTAVRADAPTGPTADAGYSGRPDTLPAAMLDGNTTTGGWSNHYVKAATALLPSFSLAHPSDWVSVSWPEAKTLSAVTAYFTTDAVRSLPAAIDVSYWDGTRFVPVDNAHIDWATASNQPTTITFDSVPTTQIRLDMTSSLPKAANGFLQIAELAFPGAT